MKSQVKFTLTQYVFANDLGHSMESLRAFLFIANEDASSCSGLFPQSAKLAANSFSVAARVSDLLQLTVRGYPT